MPSAPSHRDLFLAGRRQAVLGDTRFDTAIIDTDGSDVNVVFNVSAAMGEEVVRYLVSRLNAKSLGTSRDEDLDRYVYDTFALPRLGAKTATVTLQLSRSGTVGFTVDAGSVFGTDTGITFQTVNDVAFPDGVAGPLTVVAVAQRAGKDGNVTASAVTRVLTQQEDTTLTVSNPEAAAGGRDEEQDEAYQARARRFWPSARRGTREAIESGALNTGRVTQATAIEVINPATGLPGYRVTLHIADVNGQANTALAAEIALALDEYRGWGIPVQVTAAIPQYESIVVEGLQFEAGVDTTATLNAAASQVVGAVNATAPGRTFQKAEIYAALKRVSGLIVPDGAVVSPAGDIVPSTGTVIRTTRDRVSLSG